MELILSEEQVSELLADQYIDIKLNDNSKIYIELGSDNTPFYFELIESTNGVVDKAYAFDTNDINLLLPKKPDEPSYWHDDPLCPNCGSHMIYKFEYCPKCGQKLDWTGR